MHMCQQCWHCTWTLTMLNFLFSTNSSTISYRIICSTGHIGWWIRFGKVALFVKSIWFCIAWSGDGLLLGVQEDKDLKIVLTILQLTLVSYFAPLLGWFQPLLELISLKSNGMRWLVRLLLLTSNCSLFLWLIEEWSGVWGSSLIFSHSNQNDIC